MTQEMIPLRFDKFNIACDSLELAIECLYDECDWHRRGESPVNLHALMQAAVNHITESHLN